MAIMEKLERRMRQALIMADERVARISKTPVVEMSKKPVVELLQRVRRTLSKVDERVRSALRLEPLSCRRDDGSSTEELAGARAAGGRRRRHPPGARRRGPAGATAAGGHGVPLHP